MRNIIAIALILMATTTATANQCQPLEEQITECEALVDLADRAINKQAETIDELSAQQYRLEQALTSAMDQLAEERAWYKDTSIIGPVSFLLGVTLGALAVRGN